MSKYTPLKVCDETHYYPEWEVYEKIPVDEVDEIMIDPHQLNEFIGNHEDSSETHKIIRNVVAKSMKMRKNMPKGPRGITEDVHHGFRICSMIKKWERSKQVFSFDKDFQGILRESEITKIDANILFNLPFRTLYLDLSNLDYTIEGHKVDGAFVDVIDNKEFYVMTVVITADGGSGRSSNVWYMAKEKGIFKIQSEANVQKIWPDTLKMILYLCSANRYMGPSEDTWKTYKPYKVVRNKYSEVQKWDVGVRIGNTIRSYRENKEHIKVYVNDSYDERYKNRKRPRPHMRRGHWHKYWVGEERSQIQIKWIMPTFINIALDLAENELPVVVHPDK